MTEAGPVDLIDDEGDDVDDVLPPPPEGVCCPPSPPTPPQYCCLSSLMHCPKGSTASQQADNASWRIVSNMWSKYMFTHLHLDMGF